MYAFKMCDIVKLKVANMKMKVEEENKCATSETVKMKIQSDHYWNFYEWQLFKFNVNKYLSYNNKMFTVLEASIFKICMQEKELLLNICNFNCKK